jgi:hypothetical protein
MTTANAAAAVGGTAAIGVSGQQYAAHNSTMCNLQQQQTCITADSTPERLAAFS